MKKLNILVLGFALLVSVLFPPSASAANAGSPNLSQNSGVEQWYDHGRTFGVFLELDSQTVLPVTLEIKVVNTSQDTLLDTTVVMTTYTDSVYMRNYFTLDTFYTFYYAFSNDSGTLQIHGEAISTDGPPLGILSPGRSMVYTSGETLYVRDASDYVGAALVLYDMEGRKSREVEITAASQTVSLAGLPGGIYVLTDGKGGTLKVPIWR